MRRKFFLIFKIFQKLGQHIFKYIKQKNHFPKKSGKWFDIFKENFKPVLLCWLLFACAFLLSVLDCLSVTDGFTNCCKKPALLQHPFYQIFLLYFFSALSMDSPSFTGIINIVYLILDCKSILFPWIHKKIKYFCSPKWM